MMAVRGWGERELPDGLKWKTLPGGEVVLRDQYDSVQTFEDGAALTLQAYAPDQIEYPIEQAADALARTVGDTFIDWRIADPKKQWEKILWALNSHGYVIRPGDADE